MELRCIGLGLYGVFTCLRSPAQQSAERFYMTCRQALSTNNWPEREETKDNETKARRVTLKEETKAHNIERSYARHFFFSVMIFSRYYTIIVHSVCGHVIS